MAGSAVVLDEKALLITNKIHDFKDKISPAMGYLNILIKNYVENPGANKQLTELLTNLSKLKDTVVFDLKRTAELTEEKKAANQASYLENIRQILELAELAKNSFANSDTEKTFTDLIDSIEDTLNILAGKDVNPIKLTKLIDKVIEKQKVVIVGEHKDHKNEIIIESEIDPRFSNSIVQGRHVNFIISILQNCVGNSKRLMESQEWQKDEKPKIKIIVKPTDDNPNSFQLIIEDNGAGIEPERLERLNAGVVGSTVSVGGTGFGLAGLVAEMKKKFADKAERTIATEANPNKKTFTTFIWTLPAKIFGSPVRVLSNCPFKFVVVDDAEVNLKVFSLQLKQFMKENYEGEFAGLVIATDPQAALDWYEEQDETIEEQDETIIVLALWTDKIMPIPKGWSIEKDSGYSFAEKFREIELKKAAKRKAKLDPMPICLVSGNDKQESKDINFILVKADLKSMPIVFGKVCDSAAKIREECADVAKSHPAFKKEQPDKKKMATKKKHRKKPPTLITVKGKPERVPQSAPGEQTPFSATLPTGGLSDLPSPQSAPTGEQQRRSVIGSPPLQSVPEHAPLQSGGQGQSMSLSARTQGVVATNTNTNPDFVYVSADLSSKTPVGSATVAQKAYVADPNSDFVLVSQKPQGATDPSRANPSVQIQASSERALPSATASQPVRTTPSVRVAKQSFFSQWRNRGRGKVAPVEGVQQQATTEHKGAQVPETKLTWRQKIIGCFSRAPEQDQKPGDAPSEGKRMSKKG